MFSVSHSVSGGLFLGAGNWFLRFAGVPRLAWALIRCHKLTIKTRIRME